MRPGYDRTDFSSGGILFWGGLRYLVGLLALYCVIKFFQGRKKKWIFLSGVMSALSLLTTIESGGACLLAISLSIFAAWLLDNEKSHRRELLSAYLTFAGGILIILIPYFLYLWQTQSLAPFLETHYVVLTQIMATFIDDPANKPAHLLEFLGGLIPESKFFKVMTPIYLYLFLGIYCVYRIRKKEVTPQLFSLMVVGFYGLILYICAFRMILGAHFEMALLPEKILLFFLLEQGYLKISQWHRDVKSARMLGCFRGWAVSFLLLAVIGSSLGYAFSRYYKRFPAVKWAVSGLGFIPKKDFSLLHDQEKKPVDIERAKGMVVPAWQAEDIEAVVSFLQAHTKKDEAIFAYPELGDFYFFADRPSVGRFPNRQFFLDFGKVA